ncbi:uncharacterized protein si:dkeyp-69c1.9 isoform X3 [Electrophorus electricus]|uniref:uncharacterized protein si:dkeyp-69c1.9 isoform X3 n=1 Tax=Electrophorus electricus TaxID=8005 RepID=UPI0015CFBF99|nr:uncharacterized protein si:dkeyp-69c1.9 isoform X3 [Electrophorus electricus]
MNQAEVMATQKHQLTKQLRLPPCTGHDFCVNLLHLKRAKHPQAFPQVGELPDLAGLTLGQYKWRPTQAGTSLYTHAFFLLNLGNSSLKMKRLHSMSLAGRPQPSSLRSVMDDPLKTCGQHWHRSTDEQWLQRERATWEAQ